MDENPFFESWTAPFGLPPFERIRPEHFPPAFARGMAEQIAEIARIAAAPQPPSFANTIEAMERAGQLLGQVSRVFFNLNASMTSDALEEVARDWAPKLARHQMQIALDPTLFQRIDALHAGRGQLGLATDQLRLLERIHLDFVRQGARLGPDEKRRMADIAERLASLHTQFGQNVLHDENEWQLVLSEDDLDGLPDFARSVAAEAAKERGLGGRFVVTLARSSIEPFLTFAARRDLRQTAWEAWVQRGAHSGAHDNQPLISEVLTLRAEHARLLGYKDYAAYRFADTMAKDAGKARQLLDQVWEPARHKAAAELAVIRDCANQDGLNAAIAPWDWRYYAEKIRRRDYDLDEAELKPYFLLDNLIHAAFDTAGRLFGVTFTERRDLSLYHKDVRAFEVRNETGQPIGLFLQDNFARNGKRSGAWMSSYRDQESFAGAVLPIIVNNNNIARGEPALLGFDDARTLFHEFGHGLHGLLSHVRYPSQSGTAVLHDFVEFPSQLFERFIAAPEVLREHARHYETGAPMPDDLLRRLLRSRDFNQGFATVEYTAAALLDLDLHQAPDPAHLDTAAFEANFMAKIGMPSEISIRHRPAHFQHLFAGSGYAAGYYAYLWAEVLDTDGFAAFSEAGNIFDPALASRLKAIYAAGDTRDPMELYRAFRGREPRIEALLEHRGLVDRHTSEPRR